MNYYYIYILKCSDRTFYTGVTNNLDRRFVQHQQGLDVNSYTHKRRPVELVYSEEFGDIKEAISREKQIKGWSKKKKEALINSKHDELVRRSKRARKQKFY
jgi:putative endonuclease